MLPLTFAALALLTGALILLRIRWRCLSQKTHKALIVCASAAILLYLFTLATGWNTAAWRGSPSGICTAASGHGTDCWRESGQRGICHQARSPDSQTGRPPSK